MASLLSISDLRTFVRGMALGFQDVNAIFDALVEHIPDVIREKHNNDGTFNCREAARVTGNYTWDGATKYTLNKQASTNDLLPTEITPGVAGTIIIPFTSSLSEQTYDVQVTCGLDLTGAPGLWGYDDDPANKTAAGFRFYFKSNANADANPDGFTVTIFWGA